MDFIRRALLVVFVLEYIPTTISGLEANEGESLTLTCPRPSRQRAVVWEGPQRFQQYARGLQVSVDLSAEQRERISLSGDHAKGYYNLQIKNIQKSDSGAYRCKIGTRVVRRISLKVKTTEEQNGQGLFPYILNLATRARITANATCGETKPEYFCKLVEHVDLMPRITHCGYCNARASRRQLGEKGDAHPISNAIDGSNRWWQSPSISNGREYNYVTITLDLGLIYQVAYVVVKAANAPRPGNWILEKSVDNVNFYPWQYFAITDEDCEKNFNIRATQGKPSYDYLRDDEVRCTSYFSKLNPLENGEIFVSLTNGRPGIFVPSKTLLDFTSARYVRLRFQKIRTLNADLMSLQSRDPRNLDPSVTRRYFYSVKDVSIGGQCICYGHATECQRQGDTDRLACVCQHNTCGDNCEHCCPLFNQKPWLRGGSNENGVINRDVNCEACNCHGHAESCVYNATVDALGLSLNMNGEKSGGGVCVDCKDDTTGVNCERCLPGYYRPWGVPHDSPRPCRPCNCQESVGSTGICVEDDSRVNDGLMPGSCICQRGFAGQNCDKCDIGYHSYPNCEPCSCSLAGTVDPNMCEGRCVCKGNVEGANCDTCKVGYYDLSVDNEFGCRQCFCFGVSTVCQSAGLGLVQISDMRDAMDGWTVITLNDEGFTLFPSSVDGWLEYRTFPAREQNGLDEDRSTRDEVIYYWQAPVKYYGNRLASYGGRLHYTIQFTIDDSAPWQNHLAELDVILQGMNLSVTNGRNYIRENQENKKSIALDETNWFELDSLGRQVSQEPVGRREFMELLYDLRRILIRATHHTAQDNVMLKGVLLDTSSAGSTSDVSITGVEKCSCPRGYTGLSCESCDIGWRRLDNVLYGGTCIPCDCQGHSKTCDPYTGRCLMCTDNTEGDHCEICRHGYYGDPTRGTPDDCQPCACPLNEVTNNFATTCALSPKFDDPDAFVCLDCAPGYTGERCERCDHGYYGYPGLLGSYCKPCDCNGNIDRDMPGSCDQLSGKCRLCLHNTEGDNCGTCRLGYYGTAVNGDCKLCSCDPFGSTNMTCDTGTGQCQCKEHYTGRQCDRCESGYGDIMRGCTKCNCSRTGSLDYRCQPVTGQCVCRPGVTGLTCDHCQDGFYAYSVGGCYDCRCYHPGANISHICDLDTGKCNCLPNTTGDQCDSCKVNYWGIESGQGCTACECNPKGSYFQQCDSVNGQCRCKTGVTGLKCDQCVDGYYGLSSGECRQCEPCTLPGHICHPDTGECVCPPNTMGDSCEQCIDTYWGYDPNNGCKPCNCDGNGALDNNCDPLTGQCACKSDYNGTHCDSCLFGFFNFPDCQLCLCSVDGTEARSCDNQGACMCGETDGQCVCKENTVSRTCSKCEDNSFSLDVNNPDGCTDCFCFERADQCEQATYVWTQVSQPDMAVSFNNLASSMVTRQLNGFYVIPNNESWTGVPEDTQGDPVYWQLQNLHGDQTLSYNGDLTFTVEHGTLGNAELANLDGLVDKPLVVLIGHNLPLMYRSDVVWEQNKGLKFKVRLHEHYWRTQRNGEVDRKLMMIILQNVTDILIRASWDTSASSVKISDVSIDRAVDNVLLLGEPALGIEQCQCPPQYSGLSCQDPADGYFRIPNSGPIDFTDLIGVIGGVAKCDCNGHGATCDRETGVCLECEHSTAGDHCEVCADGYYGDATVGSAADCQRCACPLEVTSNNFSPTCERIDNTLICTACLEGYTGDRCEFCEVGYYGNPVTPGGICMNCMCNLEGSVLNQCDNTGKCQCLPGIMGDKCDQCQPRYAVIGGSCVSCDEGCTRTLMADLDELENMTASLHFDPSKVNISAPFRKLENIRKERKELSDKLQNLRVAEVNNIQKQLDDLDDQVVVVTERSEGVLEKGKQNREDAADLLEAATEVEDTISLLQLDVEELVNELEGNVAASFHNRSGVNVTASLAEARKILEEIKGRNFTGNEQAARNEHDLAEELSERILFHNLRVTNTSDAEKRISNLLDTLNDLLTRTQGSIKVSEDTTTKLALLRDILDKIKRHVSESKEKNKSLAADVMNAAKLVADAEENNNRTEENVKILEERASTLDAATEHLSEKETNLRTKMPGAADLVDKAWAHANNLSKYATELEKMFESTRSAAENPLRAAGVFNKIVAAIDEAERAAKKALQDAKDATTMTELDQLKKDVDASLRKSQELLAQANDLGIGITRLDDDIDDVDIRLDETEASQSDTIAKNTEIQGTLESLPQDFVDRLSDVKTSTDNTEIDAKRVNKRSKNIVDKVNMEMMPKLRELQNLHTDKYSDIQETLRNTKSNLTDMKILTDSIDQRIEQSRRLRSDIGVKLDKLKQSIREAREEANKVKTSLKSEGKCARKFMSVAQQGTLNTISFAFKTSEPYNDMLFILIKNQEVSPDDREKEFLSVELRNRRVRFSWNAGGGTTFIDDSQDVKSETSIIKEADKWYMVVAQRIGRLGRLTVHSIAEAPGIPRTKISVIGYSLMNFNDATEMFVSGVPDNYQLPDGITRSHFSGCMGSVNVDEQLVGLFNFQQNSGDTCMACLEVPAEAPGTNIYTYDGTGYAVTDKVKMEDPLVGSVIMEFSTYWANASLFFVGNETTGEFLSLELVNGKIVFHFYLGENTYGRLETGQIYNINKWVSVAVARNGRFGILESSMDDETQLQQAPPGDHLMHVKDSDLYFGGIPPSVNMDVYEKASGQKIIQDKFLGCMKGIQILYEFVNLWNGKTTVGLSEGCKKSGMRTIGFYGKGFAKYFGKSLDGSEGDISVSFTTLKADALLLLAKDTTGDNFYSLALLGGVVEGRFYGGGDKTVILTSNKQYNDGITHNIAVKKTDRRLEMYVDDQKIATGQLEKNYDKILVSDKGGLFLGGVPAGYSVDRMVATNEYLHGCVSDIVINGEVLNLNVPEQYGKADIGRCAHNFNKPTVNRAQPRLASDAPANLRITDAKPTKQSGTTKKDSSADMMTSDMAGSPGPVTLSPMSCASNSGPYEFELDAYTFGEEKTSFHRINVTKKEITRNFELTFDFRTFFPDGLLFYLSNLDHSSFVAAQIKNGAIVLSFDRNRKFKEVTVQPKSSLTDGDWHNVLVKKNRQRVTILVDGNSKRGAKIAKVLKVDVPLFVGGVPESFIPLLNDKVIQHSIRGSIRSMVLNDKLKSFPGKTFGDATMVRGVDQCFTKVEMGAHFTGDSYGVYEEKFVVGQLLDIELEFRTTKAEGILVTISNQDGKQALTLELHLGQVKFTVINAGGEMMTESTYSSQFNLCDNTWHKVKASVIKNVVTLQVDGAAPTTHASSKDIRNTATSDVLYIGGTPDVSRQVALSTTEGFAGCLKNVKIGQTSVDWFNLKQTVAVHKTGCPVS